MWKWKSHTQNNSHTKRITINELLFSSQNYCLKARRKIFILCQMGGWVGELFLSVLIIFFFFYVILTVLYTVKYKRIFFS